MVDQPLYFQLDVNVLEDLHSGAGTGTEDVDALVLRDRFGKPVIRASHLKGLLREAGDELVAIGRMTQTDLDALLGHDVFGRAKSASRVEKGAEPRRAALRLRSLRVAEGGKCETLVWGSSARELDSRRPADDTLRYVEHVAAGTQFRGEGFLDDPSLKDVFERLLGRIDRIGSSRNRGAGLVQASWSWIQRKKCEEPTHSYGTCLRLIVRNLEPLCLPTTGHPGNVISSHSFIRGQSLRGSLMAWAITRKERREIEKLRATMARVSVGDALPLPMGVEVAAEVLPLPLSIMTEKPRGGSERAPWWLQGASRVMFDALAAQRGQTKERARRPGSHEYLCRRAENGSWLRFRPEMNVTLRNQTPKSDTQSEAILFSVEELAEDTLFQADVLFDNTDLAETFVNTFNELLSGGDWFTLGRGGQPMRVQSIHWPQKAKAVALDSDREWTLTLTSDLVLRGPMLGFLNDLDVRTLCELVGISPNADWIVADRFVETETVHGFNGVSGIHRSPAIAIRRGSSWKIRGEGSGELARSISEMRALGERTQEGFGRFLLGVHPLGEILKVERAESTPQENRQEFLLGLAKKLSVTCEERMRKEHVGPSLSQLQWLRGRALAATDQSDTGATLNELLEEIKSAPASRPQGGKVWRSFPVDELKSELNCLPDLREKGLLISYLVKWLVPEVKKRRKHRNDH